MDEEGGCSKCGKACGRGLLHTLESCGHLFCNQCLVDHWEKNKKETECPAETCQARIPRTEIVDILSMPDGDPDTDILLPICGYCRKSIFLDISGTLLQNCRHFICYKCLKETFVLAQLSKNAARCPALCWKRIPKENVEKIKNLGKIDSELCDEILEYENRYREKKPTITVPRTVIRPPPPMVLSCRIYRNEENKKEITCSRGERIRDLKKKIQDSLKLEKSDWELYIRREFKGEDEDDEDDEDDYEDGGTEMDYEKVDMNFPQSFVSGTDIVDGDVLIVDTRGKIREYFG